MIIFQVIVSQEPFNKCVTGIQHDRTLSAEVIFQWPSESTRRTNETMWPKKRCRLMDAAAPLNVFCQSFVLIEHYS